MEAALRLMEAAMFFIVAANNPAPASQPIAAAVEPTATVVQQHVDTPKQESVIAAVAVSAVATSAAE